MGDRCESAKVPTSLRLVQTLRHGKFRWLAIGNSDHHAPSFIDAAIDSVIDASLD